VHSPLYLFVRVFTKVFISGVHVSLKRRVKRLQTFKEMMTTMTMMKTVARAPMMKERKLSRTE
jgi:hypothetical protein